MQTSAAAEASQISSPWLGYGPTCRLSVSLLPRSLCALPLLRGCGPTTTGRHRSNEAARGFNASTSQRKSLVCGQRGFDAGSDFRVADTFVDRRASQSLATAKHQD